MLFMAITAILLPVGTAIPAQVPDAEKPCYESKLV